MKLLGNLFEQHLQSELLSIIKDKTLKTSHFIT